jgi:hypothetical protein
MAHKVRSQAATVGMGPIKLMVFSDSGTILDVSPLETERIICEIILLSPDFRVYTVDTIKAE